MSERHSNHSIKIHSTAETSAVIVGLLSQVSHQLGSEITAPDTGDPYEIAQVITRQMPNLSFGTHSLKALLDLVGLTGKCIAANETKPGFVAYAQKHDACGTNGRSASNHMSITYAAGHLIANGISASVGQDAMLTGVMHGKATTQSTPPWVAAYNASLPSAASVLRNQRYTLGRPTVLQTVVTRVRSQSIDLNPQITLSEDADSIWATLVDVEKIRSLVTIVTEDPAWLNASGRIAETGTRSDHADSAIYWLRREVESVPVSGGCFMDFDASEHIEMTLSGLVHVSDHYTASGAGTGLTQIQIAGIETSAGVAPVVIDTTAVYPNGD